jgi:hypothetical protein
LANASSDQGSLPPLGSRLKLSVLALAGRRFADLDRAARSYRLGHGHRRTAVGRHHAQRLADLDQVGVLEIIPGGHILVVLAVIERDAVERVALLHRVETGTRIGCRGSAAPRGFAAAGSAATILDRRRRMAGAATEDRHSATSISSQRSVHSTPGNSGTKRTASNLDFDETLFGALDQADHLLRIPQRHHQASARRQLSQQVCGTAAAGSQDDGIKRRRLRQPKIAIGVLEADMWTA